MTIFTKSLVHFEFISACHGGPVSFFCMWMSSIFHIKFFRGGQTFIPLDGLGGSVKTLCRYGHMRKDLFLGSLVYSTDPECVDDGHTVLTTVALQ